ncbi:MAG: nucleotidyltransferase domain-containing protein [Coriobacteriales bacterium]|nr:nucleotidyltransferase domain-containing protein [Coriobacteriales bacterium]
MDVARRNPVELDVPLIAACVAPVLDDWPIRRAWLYGSVARGTQNRRSDVDIMVELDGSRELGFSFLTLEDELADALGCKVDLNTLVRSRSTPAFLQAYDRDKVMIYERQAG